MNLWFILTGPVDPQSIIDKLIPSGIWPFIMQLLSTLVMLVIVKRFLYQPIKNILVQRSVFVKKTLDEAIAREKQAQALKLSLEAETKKVQLSLKTLRQEALEEIESTKAQLLSEAQIQANRLKEKAALEISQAKSQALLDIEREIVGVALDASKKVLQRELTKQDNEKIIEDFIKGLRN
ncbi:MAG: ATP synthase F0 subunit B [Firmicutes bacterium]|nr:ATP synthase F0 subunit B [Bacillota bacterium]